jgi:TolB-like protein/tRNA A-37 threonylcarbamoyl transferase component Bud32
MSEIRDQLQRTLGDNYTLERELGGGGMSRVFVAEETSLGRKVVIKVLPPDLAAAVNLERFRREIQLAAKLQHPLIVPVLAAGVSEGLPYYTMPFIEGESLRARMSRAGELPIHDAVRVMRDMLSALSYAHDHGVVHRDIKPDNVLLTGQHAMVADFGVAKAISASTNPGSSLTSLGVALGTPAYMSPEQAAADPATDHRSDLYSVGAVAYEMLSGQQLFSNRSPQAMLAAHAMEDPEPLEKRRKSVPPMLSAVIMRALEKHAADRPQSADEMLAQLDAAVTPSSATTPYTGTMPARKVASSGRSTVMAVAAAIVLLALGSSSWYWYKQKQPTVAAVGADSLGAINGAIGSVAVIPFVNTGGNASDEYFSDGMTDELAHALSRIPKLRVAGRTSSYAFKGKTVAPQEMGKVLNVAAIVEGSIRRSGDRLRIIAQLESAKDGSVIWSDSYESKAKDVFQLQDEFTKAIVGALTPTLAGASASVAASESRGTTSGPAYDAYLKGRFFFLKRGGENLQRSVDYFAQAVKLDPKFARAHAGYAMAITTLPFYASVKNEDSLFHLGLAAAQRSIELDPNLGDGHLALSDVYSVHDRTAEAETEMLKAIALQPNDATTHQWHGDNLELLGNPAAALDEEHRAEQLDPLSAIIKIETGYAMELTRDFKGAIEYMHKGLEIDPSIQLAKQNLVPFYIWAGFPDSALVLLQQQSKEQAQNPSRSLSFNVNQDAAYAEVYAALGRWDEADVYRRRVEATGDDGSKMGVRIVFRDVSGAVDAFEKVTAKSLSGTVYGCDPQFDLLKQEPRFTARLKRVGMGICPASSPWPFPVPPPKYAVKK